VSIVEPDPSQPFARVKAKPLANLESSREVLLVWKEKSEQERAMANTKREKK